MRRRASKHLTECLNCLNEDSNGAESLTGHPAAERDSDGAEAIVGHSGDLSGAACTVMVIAVGVGVGHGIWIVGV